MESLGIFPRDVDLLGGIADDVEELKADELAGLSEFEVGFFPTGAIELGRGIVESANEKLADAHDGVGVWVVDEVGVVVVPLEVLFALEGLAEEEGEMVLAIEGEVGGDVCVGEGADGGEPVDGTGGGGDGGVGFDAGGPVCDAGGVDGAVPEAIFVSAVGGGGAVVTILVGFTEFGGAVVGGEKDEGVFV